MQFKPIWHKFSERSENKFGVMGVLLSWRKVHFEIILIKGENSESL